MNYLQISEFEFYSSIFVELIDFHGFSLRQICIHVKEGGRKEKEELNEKRFWKFYAFEINESIHLSIDDAKKDLENILFQFNVDKRMIFV